MSTSHFKRALIHTCKIERPTYEQSSSGEPIPSWATVVSAQRCRYVHQQERIAAESLSAQMVQVDLLLLSDDVDITEEDRVSDIKLYSDSSVIDAGPFTVEARLARYSESAHHISVKLERIE